MNFELTLDEANIVLAALSKLPYEHSAGLIQKMQQQAQPQLPAQEQPAQEPTAE
jgi:hypothetical protein